MIEANPAQIIANLLISAKGKSNQFAGGGFGGGGAPRQTFNLRNELGVLGQDGLFVFDLVSGISECLDYLDQISYEFSVKKAERFRTACAQLRAKLNWEFREFNSNKPEPEVNLDWLIASFEFMAIELSDHVTFKVPTDEEIKTWEESLSDLYGVIHESDIPKPLSALLTETLDCLRSSIRDLRTYGAAAASKRLMDALGRVVAAGIAAQDTDNQEAMGVVNTVMALIATMSPFLDFAAKLKALPDLYPSLTGGKGK